MTSMTVFFRFNLITGDLNALGADVQGLLHVSIVLIILLFLVIIIKDLPAQKNIKMIIIL